MLLYWLVLLAVLSVLLFFVIIYQLQIKTEVLTFIKGYTAKGLRLLYGKPFKASYNNTDNDSGRLNFFEKLSLHFIERSNIRQYLPFIEVKILLSVSLATAALSFYKAYKVFSFAPSALLIALICSGIPFLLLDIIARHNMSKMKRSLPGFISVLNRWCSVREDILYAFEKALDSGLAEPLKTFVRDMVIQVKTGIAPDDALEMLRMKVNSELFCDFTFNIRQVLKNKGDLCRILSIMEEQFFRIEEEYNRRKISTYKDRLINYLVMAAVLPLAYAFIGMNDDVKLFYLESVTGKTLLMLFLILYLSGFFITMRIGKYKY